ncbi:toxin TcdB middle/N-terminal domain-containing protein [Vibrio coralliilyticus]|uniref:toxin TcdB middle/N-terminal domain-containing protein n=1 Tax=Vibrio coralliilyticus TaxID=190893 RepID=UPI0015618CDF|nr:toxin TcdB middle/N-terminal domain-containing protein [Vibrio coralliilyticus]NRF13130.1 VCBS repeat-containing protein [Vibrio coralliilyticus]
MYRQFIAACLVVCSFSAFAMDKSALKPNLLSLPTGPGSIEGLGESFVPDLNTGTANHEFQFDVPKGRGNTAPQLSLTYNSGLGNSIVGLGRRLSVPYIQRQTDKGLPRYTKDGKDEDRFLTEIGQELVAIGDGQYRAKFATGFVVYRRLETGWQALSPDGTEYVFGQSPVDTVQSQSGEVYRWHLSQVKHLNGDVTQYHYQFLDDTRQIYLSKIEYSQSGTLSMQVLFEYQKRPDELVDYRPSFELITKQRLKKVTMRVAGQNVRHYQLNYAKQTPWRTQSQLSAIAQLDSTGEQTLMAQRFGYTSASPSERKGYLPSLATAQLNSPSTDFIDLNGDGLADMIDTSSARHRYWLHQGIDQNGEPSWSSYKNMAVNLHANIGSPAIKWADINGDGHSNLVVYDSGRTVYYAIDERGSWRKNGQFYRAGLDLHSSHVRMMDINNDKRIDVVRTVSGYGGKVTSISVRLNLEGDRWSDNIALPFNRSQHSASFASDRVYIADMNGDALQDIVYATNGELTYFPNRGLEGFGRAIRFDHMPANLFQQSAIHLADMNGDGLSDVLYIQGNSVRLMLNQGMQNGRFRLANHVKFKGKRDILEDAVRFVDINGNGSTDIVWYSRGYRKGSYTYLELFDSEQPNQLKTIDNGIGGHTAMSYQSIAMQQSLSQQAGKPWQYNVPIPMQVVNKVETRDGASDQTMVTELNYRNGYYHHLDKAFRGFEYTEQREHGNSDVATLVTKHQFHLGISDEVLAGKLKHAEASNGSGHVFWQDDYTWQARHLYHGQGGEPRSVSFAALTQRKHQIIEGGQYSPVTLTTQFDYDQHGNKTLERHLGRSDKRWQIAHRIEWQYSGDEPTNVAQNKVNYPIEKRIIGDNGELIYRERWLYDDESFGINGGRSIGAGSLTAHLEWRDPSQEESYRYTLRQRYDQYGNVIAKFDPMWGEEQGHARYFEYDDTFHAFATTETIDTGSARLTTKASYDYRFGAMTHVIDMNGHRTEFGYDDFGRLTKIARPGDSLSAPTLSYSYGVNHSLANGSINWIHTQQKGGKDGALINTRRYYDGLSRLRMTRKQSKTGVDVLDGVDYSPRGFAVSRYLPYSASGFAYVPQADKTRTQVSYDALGRELRLIHPMTSDEPMASYRLNEYRPLAIWRQNETQTSSLVGQGKLLEYDGLATDTSPLGRLRQVNEVVGVDEEGEEVGAQTYITRYDYDLLGNFTRLTDSRNNQRIMDYDSLGNLRYVSDPNRGERWSFYDAQGKVTAIRDGRNQEQHFVYDGASRVTHTYYKNLTTEDVDQPPSLTGVRLVHHYQYDSAEDVNQTNLAGQVANIRDESGESRFGYDARGRQILHQRKVTGDGIDTPFYQIRQKFDSADRLTEYTYADGSTLNYSYDASGKLASIADVLDTIEYHPSGQVSVLGFSNGVTTQREFDARHRLADQISSTARMTFERRHYSYGPNSDLARIEDNRSDAEKRVLATQLATDIVNLNQSATFLYDAYSRLIDADYGSRSFQYRYDQIGNVLSKNLANSGQDKLTSFSYGGREDGTGREGRRGYQAEFAAGPNALTSNDESIGYDSVGNRLFDGTRLYHWNTDNRLVGIDTDIGRAQYGYDFDGQRRYKKVSLNDGKTSQVIYLDSLNEIRNGKLVKYVELNGKKVASSHKGKAKFTAEQFYINDHIGSTSLILDRQAKVVSAQRFTPFGERLAQFGKSSATPYGFTGKEQDDESDLGYFSHRYLAHSSAQFITPDPVFAQSERFENPQQWSPYSYAANNPIRYTDPSGEIPIDTIFDGVNIVYDLGKIGVGYVTSNPVMVNDGLVDLACDTTAILIPYVPAGSSKVTRLSSDVGKVADDALAAGKKRGAASQLDVEGQTFKDVSGEHGIIHPKLQHALDTTPTSQQSKTHGFCAEIGCINQALKAGVDPAGGKMTTVAIGKTPPGHGKDKAACSTCSHVMHKFGIDN